MPAPYRPRPSLRERVRALGAPSARSTGPLDRLAARVRRPLDRRWFAERGRLDDLDALAADVARGLPDPSGRRVLVVSLRYWVHHSAYEAAIAQALRLRGAEVAMVGCGGGQPICEVGWGRRVAPRPCDRCGWFTDTLLAGQDVRRYRLADHLPWGADPRAAPADAASVGAGPAADGAGRISASWFVKSTELDTSAPVRRVAEDFAVATAGVERAAQAILDDFQPDVVFALSGLFAAEQALCRAAAERGIAVRTYELAARAGTLMFGTSAVAGPQDVDALWADAGDRALTPDQDGELDAMLAGRVSGESAHERYFEAPIDDAEAVRAALWIAPGVRVVSLFTTLAWDSGALDRDVGYASMLDWIERAVVAAGERGGELVLVIRVHPAEVHHGTNQPVVAELERRLGALPSNVRVVAADRPLSTDTIVRLSDLVLTYTTTVGLEAAVAGVPVGVAGQAHYRGRGFTWDVERPADLEALLDAPPAMSAEQVALARRFAYAFFFRFMVPFPVVHAPSATGIDRLPLRRADLAPGRDRYLDFVCAMLLEDGPLFLPADWDGGGAS